jgi:hypothetical protein
MMALSHKVAIYVPSKVKGVELRNAHKRWLTATLKRLGRMFGGSTYVKGVGTWVGDDGELVMENVAICYSFTDKAGLDANGDAVMDLAREIAADMRQEAVAVEMEGSLFFAVAEEATAMAA